ncbi:rfaE bifunctional protein nucleotidyltransferase chain/domain [Orenia metallireducens]|jgi:D-beta-D-heptose 7-phosphate kinase/D-beta-D-heptose 1-phosphate adenosyltransferase|uniref:D-glycero-beta-D-manno-heptose 1-phosphate adenylyltransferase n=1 Tax=Orenia metallireducens TaxID=1413210 RepID=A0A285GB82_9FIRM|nr:D-glycero-beta-D-manno-heptose 1-phosphate adenylyltransferase [Orenia metallireducens]PRX32563.1 rfaE bifunctional protein nucleotidyltransferase chain/domain [Orenia metallireducens]SNY20832.1 rfaE bifunctional protein, domain II [Orenia metallireducens]
MKITEKIYPRDELKNILEEKRVEGKNIVFTNGCFDILHVGHTRYLAEAKARGNLLVVALNSDSSVRLLKGEKRPIIPEMERAEMLANLAIVDYVTIFSEKTANQTISILKPDIYIKGGDYQIEELPEAKVVASYGGKIELVSEIKGASTTNIIEEILKRY